MPPIKRGGDDANVPTATAASTLKKKSAGSSRTGQACDRCKIRKIRCDARIGGCSPCVQNNTECRTTDRITGRATSRGHTETVESENSELRQYVVELQQQLRDNGMEPKVPSHISQGYVPGPSSWQPSEQQGSWGDLRSGGALISVPGQTERHNSQASRLPDFRPGCIGDNYVGVSSGNDWLSPIEGTSLALFGMKIDLAEFLPPEHDAATSPMSYETFLSHAFNKQQQTYCPSLPAYEQCKLYCDWYFRSVQLFVPILHKPQFMNLMYRIHHEHYQANAAETVMVHMVFALLNFQLSSRNNNLESRTISMQHYHYAVSFIPDLITGHKLEDIQALAMICQLLRCLPRPGPAWMFTNMVMGLAIELGLHRSASAWPNSTELDPHIIEMRKRVFYSLLLFHVHISGKLGRPMPLRIEDFDIEIPEPVYDCLPGEENISKWRKCSFRAAIEGMKQLKILMQVYATVYSVRSGNAAYDVNVARLENELKAVQAQLPAELSGGPQTREEDRVSMLYLELAHYECRLLLHHPSLCRSVSPKVMANNLDLCLEASTRMLHTAAQIKALMSTDTTWYYATDYLAAIFTTLFAHTERQDQMVSADLHRLREDMDLWLEVVGDIGNLLGTGSRLQEATRGIIENCLNNLGRNIAAKTASAAVTASAGTSTNSTENAHSQQQQMFTGTTSYGHTYGDSNTNNRMNGQSQSYASTPQGTTHTQPQNAYASGTQFAYSEQQNSMAPYTSTTNSYNSSAYNTSEEVKPSIETQINAAHQQLGPQDNQPPFLPAFQHPTHVQNGGYDAANRMDSGDGHNSSIHGGPAAWRHFADNMMTNMPGIGQEYMHPASALMALGGAKQNGGMDMAAASMGNLQMTQEGVPDHQTWPLVHYHPSGDGRGVVG